MDVSPPLAHYLGGLAAVARQNAVGGGVNFLFGKISPEGFPHYFFVAFLAKSSLAFLAADRAARSRASSSAARPARAGRACSSSCRWASSSSRRSARPTTSASATCCRSIRSSRWPAAGLFRRVRDAAGPAAPSGAPRPLRACRSCRRASSSRIHPHELSYFNPLAGGPEKGARDPLGLERGLGARSRAPGRRAQAPRRRPIRPSSTSAATTSSTASACPISRRSRVVRGRLVAISAFLLALGPEYYRYHGARRRRRGPWTTLRRDLAQRGRPVGPGRVLDLPLRAAGGETP